MPEKEKSGSPIDISTLALLAVAIGGAVLGHAALESSRPSEREALQQKALGDQIVPARLWQDPFEVALAYHGRIHGTTNIHFNQPEQSNAPIHRVPELAEQIRRHSGTGGHTNQVTVLEVMVSGGSYAEDAELRHRARYATLSALEVSGYAPLDAEHIGYVEKWWPRGKSLEEAADLIPMLESNKPEGETGTLVVPFEWFMPNQLQVPTRGGDVLVLWLSTDDFDDHLATRLAQFNHYLRSLIYHDSVSRSDQPPSGWPSWLHFKLINPELRSPVDELRQWSNIATDSGEPGPSSGYVPITNALAGLEIYSSWSTTADAVLAPGTNEVRRASVSNLFARAGVTFCNATCTDDELVETLIDEFALRGTDLTDTNQCIALVSEWDTEYGRALPLTFAAMVKYRQNDYFTAKTFVDSGFEELCDKLGRNAIDIYGYLRLRLSLQSWLLLDNRRRGGDNSALRACLARDFNRIMKNQRLFDYGFTITPLDFKTLHPQAASSALPTGRQVRLNRLLLENAFPRGIVKNVWCDTVAQLEREPQSWPANVWRFNYLRGVDGKASAETETREPAGKSEDQKAAKGDDTARAEGHSQLDYMPRLAAEIEEKEESWEGDHHALKAVGILGSDVYDKLLVLQSLRPNFNDELFCTTDLDARLLHPSQLKWTRNVIVASSFGLALNERLQREIPPFRDTYQTGEYLACLAALGCPDTTNLDSLTPRLFEIARDGAFDLSNDPEATTAVNIHPPNPPITLGGVVGKWDKVHLPLLCIMTLAMVGVFSPRTRGVFSAAAQAFAPETVKLPGPLRAVPPWVFRTVSLGLLVLLAGYTCFALANIFSSVGKPFTLLRGVSLWPTEIIRIFSGCLALVFLFKARRDLLANKTSLNRDYNLRGPLAKPYIRFLWERERGQPMTQGLEKVREWFQWTAPIRERLESSPEKSDLKHAYDMLTLKYQWWISIARWDHDVEDAQQNPLPGKALGRRYNLLDYWPHRMLRALLPTIFYMLLAGSIFNLFPQPFVPYRGPLGRELDHAALIFSTALQTFLIFFVVDASCLCRRLIDYLAKYPVKAYSPSTKRAAKNVNSASHADCLAECKTIQLIGSRSEAVGKLVFYPFAILFLTILSRSSWFDRWDWPRSILLITALNSCFAIWAVWQLRGAAERARKAVLDRLNERLLEALASPNPNPSPEYIRGLIEQVESCQDGAFAPISQHPAIKAVLLAASGIGLQPVLEYLAPQL